MGITSCNSASNTLQSLSQPFAVQSPQSTPRSMPQTLHHILQWKRDFAPSQSVQRAGHHKPVKVLRGANRNDSIGICESGEHTDPVYRINTRLCWGKRKGKNVLVGVLKLGADSHGVDDSGVRWLCGIENRRLGRIELKRGRTRTGCRKSVSQNRSTWSNPPCVIEFCSF